ncbi:MULTISPECIES: chalcone isomerase family protein [Pseudoalteromonas]|uniref:Chalcone isomerase family protein n=1 Tax=Pseudoalteromonas obscura TaxID=3048491 RepID=A0ABT7ENY4_9GAMM|nr:MULTISPECIES: chalcone isomerase family protein [Pseudoalteromonas]MBQ4838072.1 chalcone isomerase family protein [Pseudoalteromonas luteoviolacea]MDK2596757.1 chalcone isomerase family protein [Pseudoalteromonas sp. P94(2023)]
MKQFRYGLMALLLLVCGIANSNEVDALNLTKNMKQVGKTARMTYLFWDIYDIRLYSATGRFDSQQPFVLKLTYLRDLNGHEIAKRSLQEMEKQGFDNKQLGQQWLGQMEQIFPNVSDNYSLFGVRREDGSTLFYDNNKLLGEIKDQNFTKWFFDIWLGEKTSEPAMRAKLIGGKS